MLHNTRYQFFNYNGGYGDIGEGYYGILWVTALIVCPSMIQSSHVEEL